jgi:hypothetical protein
VAVKFTAVAPEGTVTEAPGTGNRLLLLDSDTIVPPVGDAALNVTVQVVLFPLPRLVGVHDSELRVGPLPVTVPPVAEVAIAEPDAVEAYALPTPIEVLPTPDAMVKFTTATTPFPIVFAFIPVARQVYVPEPVEQDRLLPALVEAAPAVAEMEVTLLCG